MPASYRTCRRASVTCIAAVALLAAASGRAQTQTERCPNPPAHNNVAALYCIELNYGVESVETERGQEGLCVLPDGSKCPEWDFYAGTCGAAFSLCAERGLEQHNKTDGDDTYAREYTACVEGGVEVNVSDMLGFPQRFNTCIGPTGPVITRRGPGAQPPRHGTRAGSPIRPLAPSPLPSSFTWRNKDGHDWMTSVKDQSQCGSCWAFSAVGATEAVFNIERNNPHFGLDLSEELLNGGSAGSCCGGWHDAALNIIKNSGIPDEECLPYDVADYNTGECDCFGKPSCPGSCPGLVESPVECSNLVSTQACSDEASRLTTIANFYSVPNDIDTIKTKLIDEGPLSVCYAHQGTFNAGVYECPPAWCRDAQGNPHGSCGGSSDTSCPAGTTCTPIGMNHCVVIAGYDDNGGAGNGFWIIKNSWGAGYDGDGYFNLRYDNCLVQDAVFYVDSGTTPNRAPVAEADGPYEAECQGATTALSLDGMGSSDPDADALTYSWSSTCPAPAFNDATSPTPVLSIATASLASPLACSVDLTVTDTGSLTASDSAAVLVRDTTPPAINCPANQTVECTGPQGATVSYPPPAASDVCTATVTSVCTPASGSVFPPGTTTAGCTATDASSNASSCTFQVKVADTTPPTITNTGARPDTLWPPNHKMVPVTVTAQATDLCGPATCRVVSVSSNEPVDGLGDGDTAPDWTITGDLAVSLRAERAGGGDGRVYTITVECQDSSGNGVTAPVTVRVPHDIGKK
jgi:putative hemolysin